MERGGETVKIPQTKRVAAGELKVGDTIIIPVCPQLDSGGELYGGSSVILETIVSITPYGEDGGLEFKTKWERRYSSGDSVYRFSKYSFVTKL
jgi:hypothetical protein